jgi:phage antirepressor YoqD-like protein
MLINEITIDGNTYFSLGVTAKLLNTSYGRTRFMKLLREWGVLLNKSEPSQKMIDYGYMIYFPKPINIPGKKDKIVPVTYVTIKGLNYLQKLFNNKISKRRSDNKLAKHDI